MSQWRGIFDRMTTSHPDQQSGSQRQIRRVGIKGQTETTSGAGFALLIALFLMSVMVLLSVSLSSLVQTASRVSQDELERMQARQNTWTGLKVGVGRLQGLSGQDRRATATADLTFPDSVTVGSGADSDFRDDPHAFWATRNAFWTGVWRDQRELGHLLNRPEPVPVFEGWLVSHPRAATPDPSAEFDEDEAVLLHAGGRNRANAGTPDEDRIEGRVYVPFVPFRFGPNAGEEPEGRLAFWVSDEGVKGRVNIARPASFSVSAPAQEQERWRLRSPQRFGWETLELFSSGSNTEVAANLAGTRRLVELRQWWDPDDANNYFGYDVHNFTTRSMGLLTDGRRGGLRLDLTQFRAQSPAASSLAITADDFDSGPEESFPPFANRADGLTLYRMGGWWGSTAVRNPNHTIHNNPVAYRNPTLSWVREYLNPDWSGSAIQVDEAWGNPQPFHPVFAGVGLYFDFTRQGNQLMLNVFPLYLIWNPYDVPMEQTDYTIVHDMSFDVYVQVRGQATLPNGSVFDQFIDVRNQLPSIGTGQVRLGGTHYPRSFHPVRLSDLPGSNSVGNRNRVFFNVRNLRLEPGQVALLTPQNHASPLVSGMSNNGNVNLLSANAPDTFNSEHSFVVPTGVNLPTWAQGFLVRFIVGGEVNSPLPPGQGDNFQNPRLLRGTQNVSAIANDSVAWSNAEQLNHLSLFFSTRPASVYLHTPQDEPFYQNPPHFVRPYHQMGPPWYNLPTTSDGLTRGRRLTIHYVDEADMIGVMRGPSSRAIYLPQQDNPDFSHREFNPTIAHRFMADYNLRSSLHNRNVEEMRGGGLHTAVATLNRDQDRSWSTTSDLLDNFAGPEHPFNFLGAFFEVFRPNQELLSVGQLKHVQWGKHISHEGYGLGNSLAPHYMSMSFNEVTNDGEMDPATYWFHGLSSEFSDPALDGFGVRFSARRFRGDYQVDNSYLINEAMWDRFFFSSVPPTGSLTASPEFILPNSRYRILGGLNGNSPSPADLRSFREAARHLAIVGGFNVNSTRVEAWKGLLGAFRDETVRLASGGTTGHPTYRHPYPRISNPTGDPLIPSGSNTRDPEAYHGFRALSDPEITRLAEEIVREIRIRAWPDPNQAAIEAQPYEHYRFRPALSVSDFVNRRLVNTRHTGGIIWGRASFNSPAENHRIGIHGPLQAAIDAAGINEGFNDELLYAFDENGSQEGRSQRQTIEHIEGAKAKNVPGYLSQSDLLQSLGPVLTARSDTFTILAMGESRGTAGHRLEAVVQRLPLEFEGATSAETASLNDRFGRPYRIIGYRWIAE